MGLSLALFGLASLPLAFERTCALPAPVPSDLVAAGLSLLAAANDAARKNAALYFDAAVHYPVLLEGFDAAEGLHRLLYPLRHVVALLQQNGDPAQLRAERQVMGCCHRLAWHIVSLKEACLCSTDAIACVHEPSCTSVCSLCQLDEGTRCAVLSIMSALLCRFLPMQQTATDQRNPVHYVSQAVEHKHGCCVKTHQKKLTK